MRRTPMGLFAATAKLLIQNHTCSDSINNCAIAVALGAPSVDSSG
jgi:hypothetical protein